MSILGERVLLTALLVDLYYTGSKYPAYCLLVIRRNSYKVSQARDDRLLVIMEVLNQIGHIQYWGISPAINFLADVDVEDIESEGNILRVLMTGCSDIRHILKTISEVCTLNKLQHVEVYFHETQKELLCRAFLFLHIIHEQNLNFD